MKISYIAPVLLSEIPSHKGKKGAPSYKTYFLRGFEIFANIPFFCDWQQAEE